MTWPDWRQDDDVSKKEYCAKQFDVADDSKKALERTVANEESAVASTKEAIATLAQDMASLEAGIKALDGSVAEATAQRKDENAEYKDLVASNNAAKELLARAKNRLNQFYNPKLYKAPPKKPAAGTAVLAQVSVHKQHKAAPGAPPET